MDLRPKRLAMRCNKTPHREGDNTVGAPRISLYSQRRMTPGTVTVAKETSRQKEERISKGGLDDRRPGWRWNRLCNVAARLYPFHQAGGAWPRSTTRFHRRCCAGNAAHRSPGAAEPADPNRSFAGWLRTIAQRRAIDGLRRSGRTGNRTAGAAGAADTTASAVHARAACAAGGRRCRLLSRRRWCRPARYCRPPRPLHRHRP